MDDRIRTSQEVEIRRCAEDFVYFCETYVKIKSPSRGLINFTLYPYQKRYIQALQDHNYVIAKKFRQGGFSTLTQVYFLWLSLFKFDKRISSLSKTDRECCYVSQMVRNIIKELPEWLQPKLGKCNDHCIEFTDTNSTMRFHTPIASCGVAMDYVVFDEAAFWKDAEQHWKAMWPCLSCGGRAIVVSSTNGTKNWFHDTYCDAESRKNNFHVFHSSYLEHPDYANEDWASNTKINLGARGWRQEVLCEFLDPDTRTPQQKLEDTVHFFEDMSAAEELVESMKTEPRKFKRQIKKEIDRLEDWKIGTDHLGEKGLDWSLEKPYTDEPKPLREEFPPYKPQAYQFKKMTAEEQKAFVQAYEARHNQPIGHPGFDNLRIRDTDDLAEFWTDVAELYPQYEDVKAFWVNAANERQRKTQEIEDRINEAVAVDMLVMAGVVTAQEAKTLPTYKVFARPDLKIIDMIKESGRYPDNLSLSFSEGRLCVNSVPTVIREDDVRDLYNGVFSLIGYEQAIDSAVQAITTKLDNLFMEKENNAESLAQEALK